MFKKNVCALLFGALLAACEAGKETPPVLVSDVEITFDVTFAPGDPVTVRASGFESQDRILFDIRWPLEDELFPEGYAKGIWAVERERTENSITFLAPGGYPASTVGILLMRGGIIQKLGAVRVSDGVPPSEYRLYGIWDDGDDTCLEHIDLSGGGVAGRMRIGVPLCCPVNECGTNRIYGLAPRAGGRVGLFYDLTMHYWSDSEPQYAAVGWSAGVACYLAHRSGALSLVRPQTRDLAQPVAWSLPEGMTPEMLGTVPFAGSSDGLLFLTADRGDGSFAPVLLLSRGQVWVGEPIAAGALIPFVTVRSREEEGQQRNYLAGGYVISKPGGGASELRLFDTASMHLGEPFATLDDAVVSVTVDLDREEQPLYLLTEDGEGTRRIRIYDQQQRTWQEVPGSGGLPYRAIILAR